MHTGQLGNNAAHRGRQKEIYVTVGSPAYLQRACFLQVQRSMDLSGAAVTQQLLNCFCSRLAQALLFLTLHSLLVRAAQGS